jgi:hypothetical protein
VPKSAGALIVLHIAVALIVGRSDGFLVENRRSDGGIIDGWARHRAVVGKFPMRAQLIL